MMYLYTGTPRSGKSLHSAEEIYKKLKSGKRGKNVIANFEINERTVRKCKGSFVYVDNEELLESYVDKNKTKSVGVRGFVGFANNYHKKKNGKMVENQTLIVLDECQDLFDSRTWNDKLRGEWVRFFRLHGKLGYDVILITQQDRLVDKQIRGLVEYEYIHRKVNNFNLVCAILGLLSGGNLFVCVKIWYSVGKKIGSEFFRGKKKFYDFYDSYRMFDGV